MSFLGPRPLIVAVPESDASVVAGLGLPLEVIGARVDETGLAFSNIPDGFDPHQAHLDVAGLVSASVVGQRAAKTIREHWQGRFGTGPGVFLQLADTPHPDGRRAAILEALLEDATRTIARQAARNVQLMGAVSQLRQDHAQTQSAFRALEDFVGRIALQSRQKAYFVNPNETRKPLKLAPGEVLVQRLQTSSDGLSDIGFWIHPLSPSHAGTLDVSLVTADDGARVAHWTVPAANLGDDALRFSLPIALGPDPQSVFLHITWEGSGSVRLLTALSHPDRRHAVSVNGVVRSDTLATRAWKSTPGARAEYALNGFTVEGVAPSRRKAHGHGLIDAINHKTLRSDLGFVAGSQALFLHAEPKGRIAAASLQGLDLRGASRVQCEVMTRHPSGPAVDYAIALAERTARPRRKGKLPVFDAQLSSGWQRLKPEENRRLSITLPETTHGFYDLYLMNRLATPRTSLDFAWCSFSRVELSY